MLPHSIKMVSEITEEWNVLSIKCFENCCLKCAYTYFSTQIQFLPDEQIL